MSKSSAAPGPSRVPVFALLSLGAFVLLMVAIVKWLAGGSVANSSQSLVELRADYATDLTRESASPQTGDPELEDAFDGDWVNFESDGRLLFGCLRFPRGEGPHPVAVYCHGGSAMGVSDIRDVDPLLAAGYAVFVPAWRGENGNAGNFEMFYGEVDDVIAAMDFLAQLPEIDENAISLVGHSAGATIALLAAECSDRANAVIACSPVVDVTELVRLFGPEIYEEAPFDVLDTWETDLRSPIHFLDELSCPAHLYFGSEEKELLGLTDKIGQDVREQPHAVRIELVDRPTTSRCCRRRSRPASLC